MDSAWIAYNKPKSPELANEYAGFLMALGLNGHLTKLATLNIHDYLTKVQSAKHTYIFTQLTPWLTDNCRYFFLSLPCPHLTHAQLHIVFYMTVNERCKVVWEARQWVKMKLSPLRTSNWVESSHLSCEKNNRMAHIKPCFCQITID